MHGVQLGRTFFRLQTGGMGRGGRCKGDTPDDPSIDGPGEGADDMWFMEHEDAHLYGEITHQAMFDILQTAACYITAEAAVEPNSVQYNCTDPVQLVALFRTLHFYDLGSGKGSFPLFASLLGFAFAQPTPATYAFLTQLKAGETV